MTEQLELNAEAIFETLSSFGVEYVVIGGMAAHLLQLPVPATIDVDVTPARNSENLARLADAFDTLDAGLYTADAGGTWFPRQPVENWAQYDTLHLLTKYGPLDVVFAPDGAPGGFETLAPAATEVTVREHTVLVVTRTTWEELKHASGRAKDLKHLDEYEGRRQD